MILKSAQIDSSWSQKKKKYYKNKLYNIVLLQYEQTLFSLCHIPIYFTKVVAFFFQYVLTFLNIDNTHV